MNIVSVYLPPYSDLKIEFVWKGVKIVSEVSPLNREVLKDVIANQETDKINILCRKLD